MGLGDTLSEAGVSIPQINTGAVGDYLVFILIGVLVAILLGVGAFFFINYMKWRVRVVLHRKINGKIQQVGTFKGMIQRVGKAGDTWLVVKNIKKLPRPKLWQGKFVVWYFEREDGEWINFELGDIDTQMKQVDASYVEEDMRLQRLGIQKNLEERLVKQSFWDQYGTTIMWVVFVMIVTICLVMLFNKLQGLPEALADASSKIEKMANAVEMMANRVGGGVTPVAPANSTGVGLSG